MYFGEINNSNVLKSLNIGRYIISHCLFNLLSVCLILQGISKKVSDKPYGTFMSLKRM